MATLNQIKAIGLAIGTVIGASGALLAVYATRDKETRDSWDQQTKDVVVGAYNGVKDKVTGLFSKAA